jgi:ribonuclease HI
MRNLQQLIEECDLVVYTDGSCEPVNPYGNMGWGYVIKDCTGQTIATGTGYEPEGDENSNNVAEYMGLHDALIWLIQSKHCGKKILFLSDSKLVVNQMGGFWRIKEGFYRESALVCESLIDEWFTNSRFVWIPRELNTEADELSKQAQEEICTH